MTSHKKPRKKAQAETRYWPPSSFKKQTRFSIKDTTPPRKKEKTVIGWAVVDEDGTLTLEGGLVVYATRKEARGSDLFGAEVRKVRIIPY